jgi:2-polyprenyl-6-methoxyphenol hydroxylase-like FAD-dependent oxidoreductase
MPAIVMTGGGIVGLLTAMLLARDGHEVTVLERDPMSPPNTADEAWEAWNRTGVNQFRMLHFFLPRFRAIVEAELPDLLPALAAAGGLRFNPIQEIPDQLTGGFHEDDRGYEVLTGRRPVFESVIARAADDTSGVEVRRGVAVAGLLTGTSEVSGVPHVVGVRTEDGDELTADLVVDVTGRRSALPVWLAGIGARPPVEEREDSGFLYYGRHFRSVDGAVPPALGGLLQPYGSVSTLTLPADNGCWGVGIITSAKDAPLRRLREVDAWMRTLRSFPLVAHWADGEPLDDAPAVMAKIEDRCRRFCVDEEPVATGVVAVADSWACTNPSLGRGMSIGLMHGVALRDLLRDDIESPSALVARWDAVTESVVAPWYRATLQYDRHRLAEIGAVTRGESYATEDPAWELTKAMECGSARDPDVLRAQLSIVGLLRSPDEVFAQTGFAERVMRVGGDWRDQPSAGPDRAQLLAVVAAGDE